MLLGCNVLGGPECQFSTAMVHGASSAADVAESLVPGASTSVTIQFHAK